MAFIAKIAPIEMVVGQNIRIDERTMYGGSQILVGERIFIWTSERQGGQGLAAAGRVINLENTGSRVTADIVVEASVLRPLGLTEIAPFRDIADGLPVSELARMLFRHAHNKVAMLDQQTTTFLETHFH
ncbi:hypothetical protein [Lentibacter sp. XHP0401]|uniref:hypothetical protein n=1 Tax=Lentibacter sp. XHP0401 TaxID=2984334 RepID=UPI0021E7572C|nr:hypothetical protein [Lentibacter sp. XHP0401]MCV2893710.1 hypothetical protein [Lentibacter sp. XHP0401]